MLAIVVAHIIPLLQPPPVCMAAGLGAWLQNTTSSAWRGLGDRVKQQCQRNRKGEGRGRDREVGGEGKGELDKMKETAVYKWQASIPHNAASILPPTCSDVALCGHRTASKSQAGEAKAESSKRLPPSPPPLTPRPPRHEHNLPRPRCAHSSIPPPRVKRRNRVRGGGRVCVVWLYRSHTQ